MCESNRVGKLNNVCCLCIFCSRATVIKDAKTYWVNVLSKPLICQNTDNVLGPRLAALETDFVSSVQCSRVGL